MTALVQSKATIRSVHFMLKGLALALVQYKRTSLYTASVLLYLTHLSVAIATVSNGKKYVYYFGKWIGSKCTLKFIEGSVIHFGNMMILLFVNLLGKMLNFVLYQNYGHKVGHSSGLGDLW